MISNATYATQPTTTMATTTTATTDNTTYSQKIRDAFLLLTENNYVVYQEPKWKGQGKCDWCEYEHVLHEYMDFDDETGLYDNATDLCEGCVQDRNEFAKQQHEEACAEIKKLKEENEKLKAELGTAYEMVAKANNKSWKMEKKLEEKAKTEINFDDATYTCFWSATNGDVVFWKVPNEIYDIPHPQDADASRVQSAFMDELFGDEWGTLSSHSVRTLDRETLAEIDGEGDA